MIKQLVRGAFRLTGFDLVRRNETRSTRDTHITEADWTIISAATPFTATSTQRLQSVIDAVRYVVRHQIPGDIVECGVWRGGSMMAAALTLLAEGDSSRTLYLYDTYEGMTRPSEHDVRYDGTAAATKYEYTSAANQKWCYAGLQEVKANMELTGYPAEQIRYVVGKVEDTIPASVPATISILRLDTDWYESTKHELIQLYPRVSPHGVIILDDYGHWQGARLAADEYLSTLNTPCFLNRIDYTGRLIIKPQDDQK